MSEYLYIHNFCFRLVQSLCLMTSSVSLICTTLKSHFMQPYMCCLSLISSFFYVTFRSVCTSLSFSIQACHCSSDILLSPHHLLHLHCLGNLSSQCLYSGNLRWSFSLCHFCLELWEKTSNGTWQRSTQLVAMIAWLNKGERRKRKEKRR